MSGAPQDRRGRDRLKLPYSVVLYRQGEAMPVQTTLQDISSEGFYCLSDQPFSPHEQLECDVAIPGENDRLVLRCHAEVVRVVADGLNPGYGVACRLRDYSVSRTA